MKKPLKLSEQRKQELKLSALNYLKGLCPQLNEKAHLTEPNGLRPKHRLSGTFLLEPEMVMTEAYFLETGLAILYSVDAITGLLKIFYIWEEQSLVVLFEEFMESLPVGDYYIQLIEDTELVGISNFCMDNVYKDHEVAYVLTRKILAMKTKRRMLQLDILLMEVKADRPAAFEEKFPNLVGRLTWGQVCAFIGVKHSTLGNNRG